MRNLNEVSKTELMTMDFHDNILVNGFNIIRVLGGWIYERPNPTGDDCHIVFVPRSKT
jgi:hypothetical protein